MEYEKLNNGTKIPYVGYGVYQTPPLKTTELVKNALEVGYRHIDTAQNYFNESEVGSAISQSSIDREEVFITTKTQTSSYENTVKSIDESLEKFGYDYFDLILIHWPVHDNVGTYKALEDSLKEGKARAIGLSNFNSNKFKVILDNCDVKPMVNQIETHIMWQQNHMHDFLRKNDCLHESWSPFSSGNFNLFSNEVLIEIADKHSKSVAQVILRFLTQNNIVVIPKSSSKERMCENLDIFDFKLNKSEIKKIKALNKNQSYCNWPYSMQKEK